MGMLVGEETRLLVQGITGAQGSFHTEQMVAYGTRVVAGVTPGAEGRVVAGAPVYDTVRAAVRETGANASIVFVPAAFAPDAVYEAAANGVELIVCITERIPALDAVRMCAYVRGHGARLIGPNCPGLIAPERAKVGIMPGEIHSRGPVGVISRSGTLTYEAVAALTGDGLGQSTVLGIGGDPVIGTTFVEALQLFEADPETRAVVLLGEIGGTAEEEAAEFAAGMAKPVIAYIAGRTAPPGRRMGHAGAIISGGRGTAEEKVRALERANVGVAATPAGLPDLVGVVLAGG